MNLFNRFLLGLYTFCMSVLSIFGILVLLNVVSYNTVGALFLTLIHNDVYRFVTVGIALVFALISFKFLLSGASREKSQKAVEKVSELGNISISSTSLENIILSAVKKLDGVMDIKTSLNIKKDSIKIKLKAVVTPEHSIPETSALIQERAKDAIERIAGVGVSNVEVFVENVVQTIKPVQKPKGRVE